jgi:hypothetical protein
MKKLIQNLLIIIVLLGILLMIGVNMITVEVDQSVLPENVYTEDANLATIINDHMFDLLFNSDTETEYTFVEDIMNYVILDTIRSNINPDYDPLGDCEEVSCDFILVEEYFYVEFIWAEVIDDLLVIHVSVGNDTVFEVNTLVDFYFEYETSVLQTNLTLTLNKIMLKEYDITTEQIDKYLDDATKTEIEAMVTEGVLDLTDYTYTIEYTDFIPFF